MYTDIDDTNSLSGYRTGHSFITMSLKINTFTLEFNNSLLKDVLKCVNKTKHIINRVKMQYASTI